MLEARVGRLGPARRTISRRMRPGTAPPRARADLHESTGWSPATVGWRRVFPGEASRLVDEPVEAGAIHGAPGADRQPHRQRALRRLVERKSAQPATIQDDGLAARH